MHLHWRTVVFTACTLISAWGGIAGFVTMLAAGTDCGLQRAPAKACGGMEALSLLLVPVNGFAWACYFWMGGAWIENTRVPKWVPVCGTAAALSWFLPFFLVSRKPLLETLSVAGFMSIYVAPSMIIASYLIWYHRRPKLASSL